MNSQRQKVILRTEPSLVGAALGTWLASQPGFDVILHADRDVLSGAGADDVLVVSAPIESVATVFILSADRVSIVRDGSLESFPYRDLEQLCALIKIPGSSDSYGKGLFSHRAAIDNAS